MSCCAYDVSFVKQCTGCDSALVVIGYLAMCSLECWLYPWSPLHLIGTGF